MSDESRLIQFLLYKYSKSGTMARPVLDSSQAVQVYFRMILVQILDFDETKQILISNVWKSYVSILIVKGSLLDVNNNNIYVYNSISNDY